MCNCGGKHTTHLPKPDSPAPFAIPGEAGFVYLEYTGQDARTEFGAVTGARYPFWESPVRLVDRRDADRLVASGVFREAGRGQSA